MILIGELARISAIGALLFPRSPATIAWLVVAIVVDAINRMLGRGTDAYVSKEILKFKPSVADFYSSAAVPRVTLFVRVSAAPKHSRPYFVFRPLATRHRSVGTVAKINLAHPQVAETSATSRLTAKQVGRKNNRFISVLAKAAPSCLAPLSIFCTGRDCQASELFFGQIQQRHEYIICQ